jgi:hypothetical protein
MVAAIDVGAHVTLMWGSLSRQVMLCRCLVVGAPVIVGSAMAVASSGSGASEWRYMASGLVLLWVGFRVMPVSVKGIGERLAPRIVVTLNG